MSTDPRERARELAEQADGHLTPSVATALASRSAAWSLIALTDLLSPPSPGDPEPQPVVEFTACVCPSTPCPLHPLAGWTSSTVQCSCPARPCPVHDTYTVVNTTGAASPSSGGDSPEVCGEVYPGSVEVRLCKQPRGHDGPHWLAERPPPEGEGRRSEPRRDPEPTPVERVGEDPPEPPRCNAVGYGVQCALPVDHDGMHERDGTVWATDLDGEPVTPAGEHAGEPVTDEATAPARDELTRWATAKIRETHPFGQRVYAPDVLRVVNVLGDGGYLKSAGSLPPGVVREREVLDAAKALVESWNGTRGYTRYEDDLRDAVVAADPVGWKPDLSDEAVARMRGDDAPKFKVDPDAVLPISGAPDREEGEARTGPGTPDAPGPAATGSGAIPLPVGVDVQQCPWSGQDSPANATAYCSCCRRDVDMVAGSFVRHDRYRVDADALIASLPPLPGVTKETGDG